MEKIKKINDFSNAEVGDEVYDIVSGKGEIYKIDNGTNYPIRCKFAATSDAYTIDGRWDITNKFPRLFKEPVRVITERKFKKLKKKIKPKNKFKVGDEVFHPGIGKGEVVDTSYSTKYPILVKVPSGDEYVFTKDGKFMETDKYPTLFKL